MHIPPISRRCFKHVLAYRSRLYSSDTGPLGKRTAEPWTRLPQLSSDQPTNETSDKPSHPSVDHQKQWSTDDHSVSLHMPSKFRSPEERGSSMTEHLSSVYQTVSKATIVGRTGAEAQIQTYDNGSRSATLSVATKYVSNRDGFPTVATQWHSVRVYDSASVYPLLSTLPTGSQIYVEGDLRLSTVSRDNDVTKQYSSIIVSKNQGTVRVLHRPNSYSSSDGQSR